MRPELVKSESEELDIIEREIDLGISSPIRAIMRRDGLSREDAIEEYNLYSTDITRLPTSTVANKLNQTIEPADSTFSQPTEKTKETPQPTESSSEAEELKKASLNGAQVASMVNVVQSVAEGRLPRESGLSIIIKAFNLSKEEAENILNKAGKGFKIDNGTSNN